jgi:hypothetical protein
MRGGHSHRRRSNFFQLDCHCFRAATTTPTTSTRLHHPSKQSSLPRGPGRRGPRSLAVFLPECLPRVVPLKWGGLAPNKKWALGPLISPPAGLPTATMADKFVCRAIIRRFEGNFNGETSHLHRIHSYDIRRAIRRGGAFCRCASREACVYSMYIRLTGDHAGTEIL